MGKTTRFGVSLDTDLLEPFDALCERRGCANRSEAIRDLIRAALVDDAWERANAAGAGTLTLVYDHHRSDLAHKLNAVQHEAHECVVASLHVHLDHDNCLEVIVLQGEGRQIRAMAQRLLAIKGVKHGALTLTTTGRGLA